MLLNIAEMTAYLGEYFPKEFLLKEAFTMGETVGASRSMRTKIMKPLQN